MYITMRVWCIRLKVWDGSEMLGHPLMQNMPLCGFHSHYDVFEVDNMSSYRCYRW